MSKKETVFKNYVCTMIIASSLFSSYSSAATPTTTVPGPSSEVTLLSNAIAIGGENISQNEIQNQLVRAVQVYEQNAPIDGRADRLQAALTELNVMTFEQAQDFRSNIETTSGSQQGADAKLNQQLQSVLSNTPGAQFSGYCKSMYEGYGAFAAVSEGMLAYVGHPVEGLVILSVFFVGMSSTRGCL